MGIVRVGSTDNDDLEHTAFDGIPSTRIMRRNRLVPSSNSPALDLDTDFG